MIELNGIANIKMKLDLVKMEGEISSQDYADIDEQLDVLNRYMMAIADLLPKDAKVPKWHEVRDNREKYLTNKERFAQQK